MTESCPKKTNIAEISPHLICALCGGYLIDATTIVECLHSFCKTCIVRYLESSKYCPICEVLVHKTRPLQNIRLDHTLQDIVYKLVPNLFQSEMKRRREFYKDHPTIRSAKVRQEQQRHRYIYSADEQFSISLEFCPDGCIRKQSARRSRKRSKQLIPERRYFLCPAGTTVGLLKKFVRLKFALSDKFQVDVFHEKGPLKNHYSLMDVAYIYSWKREGVLQLYYSVYQTPNPVPTITITEIKSENSQELTDDTSQKLEDTRPSTLFNKATLLGNHSVDRNIPHDLSPLELIATVANDICIQEGRGLKRKPDDAQLYENDDENSSTETRQLQKSIERAIDLCSYSNQGSPARATVSNSVATSSTSVCTSSSSSSTANVAQISSVATTPIESNLTDNKAANDSLNGKITSEVQHNSSEKKVSSVKDKPKKTDTASQCDPRPKKHKIDSGTSNHSKAAQKAPNTGKVAKPTNSNKTENMGIAEPRTVNKTEASISNGDSDIEKTCVVASTASQQKTSESQSKTAKTLNTSAETNKTKESAKETVAETKVTSESSIITSSHTSLTSTATTVSKSNSSVGARSGNKTVGSVSTGKASSISNSGLKPSAASPSKPASNQSKTGNTLNQSTPTHAVDKASSGQLPGKTSSNSSKNSTSSLSKSSNSPVKSVDAVKASTLINGHSNPSEVAKQPVKTSSSVKPKVSDGKE